LPRTPSPLAAFASASLRCLIGFLWNDDRLADGMSDRFPWNTQLSTDATETYTEPRHRTLGEMYISDEKASPALQLLVEGNSTRSTMRITGLDGNTITF
jgi:hypothetical protein